MLRMCQLRRMVFCLGCLCPVSTGIAGVSDTTWFGGSDPNTGIAVQGGIWDFEDCTTQGWSSVDRSDEGLFVTHVTPDSNAVHGDGDVTAINSSGSIWFGAHADRAEEECWPGGQGYDNAWVQVVRKTFSYGGSGDVTIEFDYFADSSAGFDFTYVYVATDDVTIGPLNPGAWGPGYSGSVGSPESPAHAVLVASEVDLATVVDSFDVVFQFEANESESDGWDALGTTIDTIGGFGLDNVGVVGNSLDDFSDFEPGAIGGAEHDGWRLYEAPPIGSFGDVATLEDVDTNQEVPESCPVVGCVLLASDALGGGDPHPYLQHETLRSNAVPAVEMMVDAVVLEFDAWLNWPDGMGIFFYLGVEYYPWTCPESGVVGWSPIPTLSASGVAAPAICASDAVVDVTGDLPPIALVDSLRIGIIMQRSCDPFSPSCARDAFSNAPSPFFDNLRVGFVRSSVGVPDHSWPGPRPYEVVPSHNPINTGVLCTFFLPNAESVQLSVYDVSGRLVRLLRDEDLPRGEHSTGWNATDSAERRVAPGTYFLRLKTPHASHTSRVIVAR